MSGDALDGEIVAGDMRQRSLLAEAGDRTINDVGLGFLRRLVRDAEFAVHARTERFHDDIGAADQAMRDFLAVVRGQVQFDGALAAIHEFEIDAGIALAGRVVAAHVADAGLLHLDYLGAEVGQELRAPRARQ